MINKSQKPGFTLVELLVVVAISTVVLGISVSVYGLFRKSITLDENKAAIAQNARVAFDRMTREIRQTPNIITDFPTGPNDNSIAQPGAIEFEDGHAQDQTYRRYYISQGILELDINEYYFSYAPGTRVNYNAAGNNGATPIKHVISTQDVADGVKSLIFYGGKPLRFYMTTGDNLNQTFQLRTDIYERNL